MYMLPTTGSGRSYALTLDVINYVCVACMSVEVVVKMYTLSLKDFLHDWAGKLDLAIVLISVPYGRRWCCQCSCT